MLKESYDDAKRLLTEHRKALDKIAAFLIEKETITGKEFMKIFREVKGLPDPDQPVEAPQEPTASSISSEEAGAPTTISHNEPEA